jgi:hypothetical protein
MEENLRETKKNRVMLHDILGHLNNNALAGISRSGDIEEIPANTLLELQGLNAMLAEVVSTLVYISLILQFIVASYIIYDIDSSSLVLQFFLM